ncbi:50S ribosomal protein L15e [Candidatus Woesearchaeota archaeon]|nr:50S ribosomal protein L15e [Candidatus Woesearchaeota archaeon]
MGIYKYIRNSWQSETPEIKALWKDRLISWRREPSTLRLEHPTRLDRARALGYRAKDGVIIVRQRVNRGTHRREDWSGGRHSSNMQIRMNLQFNYQSIAERRVNDVYHNCEVLGSYFVAKDGKHAWYEVILVDRSHPQVLADERLAGVAKQRARAYRGLTSANRKTRGLRHKGKGTEHARGKRF